MENTPEQLKKLAQIFSTEKIISPQEIEAVLTAIVSILADNKKGLDTFTEKYKADLQSTIKNIIKEHQNIVARVENTVESSSNSTEENVRSQISLFNNKIEQLFAEVRSIMPKDGEDADEELIIASVLERIKLPEYKEVVLDEVYEKLEALDTKLKELKDKPVSNAKGGFGGSRYLSRLADVKITDIQDGDVVAWNSTTGRFENSTGSSAGTWGTITGTLANQTDLQTALDNKVAKNGVITGATKTKITYDSKGLVTSGADATTADIADSANKRYVTDAQLTILGNTSGVNTGDQTISDATITTSDITTNNFTTVKHGFVPKGTNVGNFLRDDGTWAALPGGGTVTTVSVVSANGFAGSVANATTTPAITITTSITGILKGNGTAISAAVADTDYLVPATAASTYVPLTYIDTDITLAANSDTKIASQKAIKAYVDGVAQGLSIKESVQVATAAALPTNTYSNGASGVGATLTAVATGVLTVDGVAVALNDRVLVKNEVTAANNGVYKCTVAGAIGVAFILTRATNFDQAAEVPGAFTFVENGTVNDGAGFVVADAGPFTIGTTAIPFTQFSGAGQITAGNGLTKSGNTLTIDTAITADKTTAQVFTNKDLSSGTNTFPTLNQNTTGSAATLTTPRAINGVNFDGSAAITVTAAAGTLTGATLAAGVTASSLTTFGTMVSPTMTTPVINGTITGTGQATAATASTITMRDSNANITANNYIGGYTTTATAAGTTTLTVGSTYTQFFTGSTTQTVTLPVASTLTLGHCFEIFNASTGLVTVNSSGGNAVLILAGGTSALFTCILASGTSAASWSVDYGGAVPATGKKLSISNILTLAGTDSTTMTFPSTSATIARTDAANTFTGVQSMTSPDTTTSITTASTSFTAWAGATTLLTIGGTGASASLFAPSTLDATSSITGAIRTSGGISAAKALNVGTTITGGGNLTIGTSNSATVGTIELGAATDTTLSRVSAGVIAVEGVTIPTISSTSTITNKRIEPRVVSAASYTTDTGTSLDVATTDLFVITAQAGALLFNSPSGTPVQGQKLMIRIKDNGTARALTYNAVFRASSDLALPTTTVLSKTLYMGFVYNSTDTKWDLLAVLNNF